MEFYYIVKAIEGMYFDFFKKKGILVSNGINIVIHLGLPKGWEKKRDELGRIYYIDHITKATQWEDPTVGQSRDALLMSYNRNTFIFCEIPDKTNKSYYKSGTGDQSSIKTEEDTDAIDRALRGSIFGVPNNTDSQSPSCCLKKTRMVGTGDQWEQSYFSIHFSNNENPFSFPPKHYASPYEEYTFNPVCPYFDLEHTKFRNIKRSINHDPYLISRKNRAHNYIHNCRLPRWYYGQWRRNRLGKLRYLIH